MRILVVSNLYPPAFIGGYEIGASWIVDCLKLNGHEILLLTCDQIFANQNGKPHHLTHEGDSSPEHIDLGLCLYEFDVVNQLIIGEGNDEIEPVRRAFARFLDTYEERRADRRKAIVTFGPDLILVFNPACILAPVFAELDSIPSLDGQPRTAFISDDWMARWPHNHPLIYIKEHHDASKRLNMTELADNPLFALGRELQEAGLFNFEHPMRFDRTLFCSRFLLESTFQSRPPPGADVAHWGLPNLGTYPHRNPNAFDRDTPLRIAYCGQVAPHKGLGSLLRALTLCRAPHSLIVIGNDKTDHGAFCRSFVREAGLGDRIHFTGTLAPRDVPATLSSKAEVFIHPSESDPSGFEEPFSIVLLQAMACGLAVAASNSGGSKEAFEEGITGLHFEAGDAAGIARILDRLENDRPLARNIAEAGRALAMKEHRIETMTEHILGSAEVTRPAEVSPAIYVAVNNASLDPANSGCVRVTRRLGRGLQHLTRPTFVRWEAAESAFRPLTPVQSETLSRFNGPVGNSMNDDTVEGLDVAGPGMMLLPELMESNALSTAIKTARASGLKVAAIFYDAIPLLRPEFCNKAIRSSHAAYMRTLADCDLVIPISHFSSKCLSDLWEKDGVAPTEIIPLLLPGDFGKHRPELTFPPENSPIEFLCVSTLEPRKNHRGLIAAVTRIATEYPELDWKLHLVGNQYEGARDLADFITLATRENPRIVYHGIVDDDQLVALYNQCHFSVYPSLIEGYGLPIIESVFFNRPCICSNSGVMVELATPGGCLAVDVEDEAAIADAIYCLITNSETRQSLAYACSQRPIPTWKDYSEAFFDLLTKRSAQSSSGEVENPPPPLSEPQNFVDRTLYKGLLTSNWQMSDSERLAIMGILHSIESEYALEIGTYQGGSLSLIAKHSKRVVSVDIDPEIPGKFKQFQNVEFLTAYSDQVLPILFREMKAEGNAFHFILIDGDHSEEGVRRDINIVLGEMDGASPCVVMMHDSFNPGCRNGILNADWEACPWVHHVDIDFIPGRIVQQNGPFDGEMWGGLALALIEPRIRQIPLKIIQSAMNQFDLLSSGTLCR